jgi:hypothetical protein
VKLSSFVPAAAARLPLQGAYRLRAGRKKGALFLVYISIGGDMAVRDRSIIGIFDLDGTSLSKKTMEYLEDAEKNGALLNVTEDVPKTFLVTEEYGMEKVYFTQLSAATIEQRIL